MRNTIFAIFAVVAAGCNADELARQVAHVRIVPQPTGTQTALEKPPGIALGEVPLYGAQTAEFLVENDSQAHLRIDAVEVIDAQHGQVRWELLRNAHAAVPLPATLEPYATFLLRVHLTPHTDGQHATATLAVHTDGGIDGQEQGLARVQGTGTFIGAPHLQLIYGGHIHPQDGACRSQAQDAADAPDAVDAADAADAADAPDAADTADAPEASQSTTPSAQGGRTVCRLPTLDFSNIPVGRSATQSVVLRNLPAAGTCQLPPVDANTPNCAPVCVVTFAHDPAAYDIGLGFVPAEAGFGIAGSTVLPFGLAPSHPDCPQTDGSIARGELRLLVQFAGRDEEHESIEGMLILESNAPNATVVEVPLRASVRTAPVAVATLQACDGTTAPDACTDADAIQPLQRVFLDGSGSYDPQQPDNPAAIASYRWEIIEWPTGADVQAMAPQGSNAAQYSVWLPLAGRYVARLHVTNTLGIESGVSDTSDVEIIALPDSRVHVQLVWDHATNDQDLHVVYVGAGDLVYGAQSDCFWKNCRPSTCTPEANCTPVQWFADTPPYEGPNPRLDIDDTHGLGPENINIDAPAAGTYRIYVYYYGLVDPVDVPTPVTVRVYIDGTLQAEYRRILSRNDLWAVAQIDWEEGGTGRLSTASADADGQVGSIRKLHYSPYPDGIYFGPVF